MNHQEIMTLIIAYTCVGIFVATACITIFSLTGILRVEAKTRNRLYAILIFEVVAIGTGVFGKVLTLSPKPLENKIENLETSNQTLYAFPDKPSSTTPPSDLKPRVYFHIKNESQRAQAKQLADQLESRSNVSVPSVQRVDTGPTTTELRYFKTTEEQKAKQIADDLSALGIKVLTKYVPGFESSNKIRPLHYEFWLSSNGG